MTKPSGHSFHTTMGANATTTTVHMMAVDTEPSRHRAIARWSTSTPNQKAM